MKKIFAIIVAANLSISMLPMTVWGVSSNTLIYDSVSENEIEEDELVGSKISIPGKNGYRGGTIYFNLKTGTITGADSSISSILIPETIRGVKVTQVGAGAFYRCGNLKSIKFSKGLKNIGDQAFRGCTGLTSISLPEGTTTLGDEVFRGCSSLTSIQLPSSITYIGGEAFRDCANLKSMELPKGVKGITYRTFDGCSSLESIIIPSSVKSIGFYGFVGCNKLADIYYYGTRAQWNMISKSGARIPATTTIHFLGSDSKLQVASNQRIMYRLYNPNSGEHFYTASKGERDVTIRAGWKYEGIGWTAPVKSKTPVYRLYNPNVGDHHYTTSLGEKNALVKVGWKYEGIGWYSDDAKGTPLYRQYNPNAKTGSHNFTTSKGENDALVKNGWKAEGIAWYGVKR